MGNKRKVSLTILRKDGTLYYRRPKEHNDVDGGFMAGDRDGWVAPLDSSAFFTAFNIPWLEDTVDEDGNVTESAMDKALVPGHVGEGNWFRWGMKTRGLAMDAQGMILSADTTWRDRQQSGEKGEDLSRAMNQSLQDRCEQAAIAVTRFNDNQTAKLGSNVLIGIIAIIAIISIWYVLPGALDQIGNTGASLSGVLGTSPQANIDPGYQPPVAVGDDPVNVPFPDASQDIVTDTSVDSRSDLLQPTVVAEDSSGN